MVTVPLSQLFCICLIVRCFVLYRLGDDRARSGQPIPGIRWLLLGVVFTVGMIVMIQGIAGIRFKASSGSGRYYIVVYVTHQVLLVVLNTCHVHSAL